MEHPGGLSAWKHHVKSGFLDGIDYVRIPTAGANEDSITQLFETVLLNAPKSSYAVVSISHVLATTGQIMPISKLARIAHAHGALLIVDGAQSTGSVERLNLSSYGVDAYTISGHKGLLGPSGSGLLYISKQSRSYIQPGVLDDGYYGYSHSAGTAPLQTILGLGYSLDFIQACGGLDKVASHAKELAAQTHQGLLELQKSKRIPDLLLLSPSGCHSSIVTLGMPCGVNVQDIIANLRRHGFVVKNLADQEGAPKVFGNSLRVSYHMYNSASDVERFLRALENALDEALALLERN